MLMSKNDIADRNFRITNNNAIDMRVGAELIVNSQQVQK